jgi:hypothetical protein
MVSAHLTAAWAMSVAREILPRRYPGAAAALLAGSSARGASTPTSDIDLVVLYAHLEAASRQSFVHEGAAFEAFVHDPQTLRWFFQSDVERGRPVLLRMVVEGKPFGPDPAAFAALQAEAQALLAKGPPPLAGEALELARYELTEKLDDLRDVIEPAERQSLGAALYVRLTELMLLGRGRWIGAGKWTPRLLAGADPLLARATADAFDRLFRLGDAGAVLALGDAELDRLGGRLFDGFERRAGPDQRRQD